MSLFLIVFIIIYILISLLDIYFYGEILKVLEFSNLDSDQVLETFGYYNKSIFTNKIYILIIAMLISMLIYVVFKIIVVRKQKNNSLKIKNLEKDLIRINNGDYSININKDDEYNTLRDEMYKTVINLKSLENDSRVQKDRLKVDLENIAHQLKTPITSIKFMSELIRTDDENLFLYLDKLDIELERLHYFTEILLKISKVDSQTIEYKMVEVNIQELLDEIIIKLNKDTNIEIKYNEDNFIIIGDEIWLYEAFLNILKNSFEHTSTYIDIKFENNPVYKAITISDDGCGLDDQELTKIFDRFYRGSNYVNGYGIGLNLSKIIIENHSGEISAYSHNGLTYIIKFYDVT